MTDRVLRLGRNAPIAATILVLGLSACTPSEQTADTTTTSSQESDPRDVGPDVEGDEARSSTTPTPGEQTAGTIESGELVEVIDGDTFDVLIAGRTERVRLIGIDTPERGDCLFDEAATALEVLLDGREIELVADTTDRDRYGRLLRYVWVGDTFVNEALVGSGLAFARRYPPDTAQAERLEDAEATARAALAGRWQPEACGRLAVDDDGSPSNLRIDHIEYDAPGDDSLALNGEWVRIVNDGAATIDLDGWQLRDDSASHRYHFGATPLTPGASVTVYSGCGTDTDTERFWCMTSSAIWNNDGDTAYLIDPAGNVATSRSY